MTPRSATTPPDQDKPPARRRRPAAPEAAPDAQAPGEYQHVVDPAVADLDPKRGLQAKIAEVTGAVRWIPKNGFNREHNYAFVREADVTSAVALELAARNMNVRLRWARGDEVPPNQEVVSCAAGKTRSGAHMNLWNGWLCGVITDGDTGDVEETPWLAESQDMQDKGIAKLLTMGKKTFLLNRFLLSTGDDPEASADSSQERQATNGGASAPAPAPAGPSRSQLITDLLARGDALKIDREKLRTIMRIATTSDALPDGVASFRDLTAEQAVKAMAWTNDYAAHKDVAEEHITRWLRDHPDVRPQEPAADPPAPDPDGVPEAPADPPATAPQAASESAGTDNADPYADTFGEAEPLDDDPPAWATTGDGGATDPDLPS